MRQEDACCAHQVMRILAKTKPKRKCCETALQVLGRSTSDFIHHTAFRRAHHADIERLLVCFCGMLRTLKRSLSTYAYTSDDDEVRQGQRCHNVQRTRTRVWDSLRTLGVGQRNEGCDELLSLKYSSVLDANGESPNGPTSNQCTLAH